jgi:hypothetical protein
VLSSPILETFYLHRIRKNLQINKRNLQLHQHSFKVSLRNLSFNLPNLFSTLNLRFNLVRNLQCQHSLHKTNNPWLVQVVSNPLLINMIYVPNQI